MKTQLFVDSGLLSPYALSAFVALRHKQVPFDLVKVDLGAGQHLTSEYGRQSLTSKVPMLVVDGWSLSESSAIAEYVEDAWTGPPLYPEDARDKARARQLQAWLRSDLGDLRASRNTEGVFLGRKLGPMTPAAALQADKLIRVCSGLLEDGRNSLFDRWCIADVDLAVTLKRLINQGDDVPQALIAYATSQWQRPEIQEWLTLQRSA